MSTVQELLAQKATLDSQIAEAKAKSFTDLLNRTVVHCDDHGFGLDQMASALISAHKRRTSKKASRGASKFRHEPTGATWTGVGRKPKWFDDFENVKSL